MKSCFCAATTVAWSTKSLRGCSGSRGTGILIAGSTAPTTTATVTATIAVGGERCKRQPVRATHATHQKESGTDSAPLHTLQSSLIVAMIPMLVVTVRVCVCRGWAGVGEVAQEEFNMLCTGAQSTRDRPHPAQGSSYQACPTSTPQLPLVVTNSSIGASNLEYRGGGVPQVAAQSDQARPLALVALPTPDSPL